MSLERLLGNTSVPQNMKEYLSCCRITKILVSQADKAWEIYFQCPFAPDGKMLEGLDSLWREAFGDSFSRKYHFEISTTYSSLEALYEKAWPDVLEKLYNLIPSCRGWLADAVYRVSAPTLQIIVKRESAWDYLTAHGVKNKLEEILQNEHRLTVQVILVLEEEAQDTSADFEEIEGQYREMLAETAALKSPGKKQTKRKKNGQAIIIGKKIAGQPVPLRDVVEEERSIIISGYLFNLEYRPLKTGRTLVSFHISDKTDSLACKILAEPDTLAALENSLGEKKWYLLRGTLQTDRYTQELTLMPYDVREIETPCREDTAEEKRVELHLHTKMSAFDGLVGIREVICRAKEWGHAALAITDHGVIQAFPEAYEASVKMNVKLLYGLEAYIFDDGAPAAVGKTPTYHCIILTLNQSGLRNLYELVTLSHMKYFYRVPRIPKSQLARLRDGLLIGSACEAGELIRGYIAGADINKLQEIADFYDFLEIQPRGNNRFMLENGTFDSEEELLKMNRSIYELGKSMDKMVVATGDVHFLDPEDEICRRILMAGKGFEDADNQAPLYYKTTQEMLDEFAYLGPAAVREVVIENPNKIAALAEKIKPIPDELYSPEIPGAEEEITRLCMESAHELYGDVLPEIVQKRIDRELTSIITHGFAVLYLIAHKLVKKSNEDGYIVGSRGSVGSSLVATFCKITEVNPLPPHYRCSHCRYSRFLENESVESGAGLPDAGCPVCGQPLLKDGHDIFFEVFMGFEGDKVPDIDLNFSGDYQPKAHKYTEELFGKDNVFRAGTIATVASKTAFGFVKNYYEEKGQVVRLAEINRLVDGCTGVKRTTGQHPGGVMVLPKGLDIHMFTPLQRPADDQKSETVTTHFDYHSISSRLVKLDILGHDDPTVLKMLEDLTGVDCKTIPLDEKKVLSLFQNTGVLGIDPQDLGTNLGTLGIPEFGTKFVRQMLEDTKPATFSELVRISGFSHGTDVWLNNAQDLIKSGTAKLSEVISARDDIMLYLIAKGVDSGRAFKVMESVRKGKGVKPDDAEALKAKNVPDWYIESCQKIKYLFPKAHAVAYVIMAFRVAYYKVYYPAAYYASFFSVRADEFDADIIIGGKTAIRKKMEEIQKKGKEATQKEEKLSAILELALEMYLRAITLRKVDLNLSDSTKFRIMDEGRSLLPPLVSLQGLGQSAALSILASRNDRPYTSREDLRIRAKLSKTVLDVLDQHGCLQDLPESDQISLW